MTTEDKFGGDYDKAVKAYNEAQALIGRQSTQITQLTSQHAEAQVTIQDLQTAKSQLESDAASGGSLYDWANGKMRAEDGSIDSGLVAAMGKLGATPEQTKALVENVEYVQTVVKQQEDSAINENFGSRQNYDAALEWAKGNLDPSKVSAINALLGHRDTAAHGLAMLKSESTTGGLTFDKQEQPNPQQNNEPGQLPPNTGGNVGGPAPLKPGSPEDKAARKEAFASNDPAKVAEYERRLLEGQRSG